MNIQTKKGCRHHDSIASDPAREKAQYGLHGHENGLMIGLK
jgi:hypothetical protein